MISLSVQVEHYILMLLVDICMYYFYIYYSAVISIIYLAGGIVSVFPGHIPAINLSSEVITLV